MCNASEQQIRIFSIVKYAYFKKRKGLNSFHKCTYAFAPTWEPSCGQTVIRSFTSLALVSDDILNDCKHEIHQCISSLSWMNIGQDYGTLTHANTSSSMDRTLDSTVHRSYSSSEFLMECGERGEHTWETNLVLRWLLLEWLLLRLDERRDFLALLRSSCSSLSYKLEGSLMDL